MSEGRVWGETQRLCSVIYATLVLIVPTYSLGVRTRVVSGVWDLVLDALGNLMLVSN